MSDTAYIIEERESCLVFKITRPHRLNAITTEVLNGLCDCIDTLEDQEGNRGLVITGEGERAFCAGTDLFERETLSSRQQREKSDRARHLLVRLHRAPFISIAALNGLAYGGGLELALACVFRIANEDVQCSLPEVKIGLIPAYAGTQLLPSIVGQSRALDMMLTGRAVSTEEALQIGLINRVAAADISLIDQAVEYLESITQYSKTAINAIRHSAAESGAQLSDYGLEIEKDWVERVAQSEDAHEGVAAFRKKRKPIFKHR
ncbi:MAG: enoyl-CoA hydratase/isomerase family protein [Gammaproteobacteria bacterium]|jgi:enoyl-CoA hydratase|nr:enoyl-CoA hydratase/isomerase family protein [Gammaproteobacteria bacterium]MBT3859848.1 enoyl-CoA hydratase/isomerase family protein [Gammaproteobacteria bacterium]MBT3988498.1 enoyl-CoA hydratase/isomerase family protein [Gammaproteobacteria bacterium]MBT4257421.1 enoyl-CoA hydratase/isomerase family protein [Gammaproteobacteria bacterium]MBT4583168.1 enoyl-CoA hydratase/isomerase family protein [Gammaproteobacteria bacterium]